MKKNIKKTCKLIFYLYLCSTQTFIIIMKITNVPDLHGLSYEELLKIISIKFNCFLTEIPQKVFQCKNLTTLYLSGNQLKELPSQIGELKNLTSLYLSGNQLEELSSQIGELKNLTTLYLGSNQLKELPSQIGELKNLTSLDLGSNQLKELPSQIGKLENLIWLDLRGNPLIELPIELRDMKKLKAFYCDSIGNPDNKTVFNSLSNRAFLLMKDKSVLCGCTRHETIQDFEKLVCKKYKGGLKEYSPEFYHFIK